MGSTLERERIERRKEPFDLNLLQEARRFAFQAIEEISRGIEPGMNEAHGNQRIEKVLKSMGAKHWHRPHLRFGKNTTLNYAEISDPEVVLGSDDIYFIDIGPVWNGYEADAGKTFVIGTDPLKLQAARDVEEIFARTRDYWKTAGATGIGLYAYAEELARQKGWILGREMMSGHRLSDFSHSVYFKGKLGDVDFAPSSDTWVLEIHLIHPDRKFGAFYEDLLCEN